MTWTTRPPRTYAPCTRCGITRQINETRINRQGHPGMCRDCRSVEHDQSHGIQGYKNGHRCQVCRAAKAAEMRRYLDRKRTKVAA